MVIIDREEGDVDKGAADSSFCNHYACIIYGNGRKCSHAVSLFTFTDYVLENVCYILSIDHHKTALYKTFVEFVGNF